MGTRALFTFEDTTESFHVYKHSDGYPEGALEALRAAVPLAWELPRFEPDEFAAAFVAGNKSRPGHIRIMRSGTIEDICTADAAFWYVVTAKGKELHISCYSVDNWDTFKKKKLFSGNLIKFAAFVEKGN
jgi:hypothetical protein